MGLEINSTISAYQLLFGLLLHYVSTNYVGDFPDEILIFLQEKLNQPNHSHKFKEFLELLQNRIGSEFVVGFMRHCKMLESVDSIFELVQELSNLLKDPSQMNGVGYPRVEGTSMVGQFIRKFRLSFEMMMFQDVYNLFEQFKKYCLGRNDHVLSIKEVECIIDEMTNNLNKVPHGIEGKLNVLSAHYPDVDKIHYLKYLYYVRTRHWQKALDSLHQFFDYCYVDRQTDNSEEGEGHYMGKNVSMIASYAGLHMASLYYHFGKWECAKRAIHETIRIAQQKGENECLSLSLAWLFRLEQINSNPESNFETAKLMEKCIEKSRKLKMPELLVQSLLVSAKMMALRYSPNQVPHQREKGNDSLALRIQDRILEADSTSNNELLDEMKITTQLTMSTLWDYFGNTDIGRMYNEIDMKKANHEDMLVSITKSAMYFAAEGNYKQSLRTMLMYAGDISTNIQWHQSVYGLLFEAFLAQGKLQKAHAILQILTELNTHHSAEYSIELLHKQAELEMGYKNLMKAAQFSSNGIEICKKTALKANYVRFLLLISDIYIESDFPPKAMKNLMKGITICRENSMKVNLARFMMRLSELQLLKGNNSQSCQVIHPFLSCIVQNGNRLDRARLYAIQGHQSKNMKEYSRAIKLYTKALREYTAGNYYHGMQRCHRELSLIYHQTQNLEMRELHAKKSIFLSIELEKNQRQPGCDTYQIDDVKSWIQNECELLP